VDDVRYADGGEVGVDAGGPSWTVACLVDAGGCVGAPPVCCHRYGSGGLGSDECQASSSACIGVASQQARVECDDMADCPDKRVCCVRSQASWVISATCDISVNCTDGEIACSTQNDQCPAGFTCQPVDDLYHVCRNL
jgi:hypothetical protein